MRKEAKIAKELIKLAKQIVGANQYENTHSDDAAKIQSASIDDLIDYLERMIDLYLTLAKKRGNFMASLGHAQDAIKRPLVIELVNDPLLIEDKLMTVKGVQLPYNAIKKDVENSLISINKALSERVAMDLQAAHKSTFGIVSRFSQIGLAIMQRLNRAYQHMLANDGDADIAFVEKVVEMLKKYNMEIKTWDSQSKNKTDWNDGSELRNFEQVQKGTREQMNTKGTLGPIGSIPAGVGVVTAKAALKTMERCSKNMYMAITYLDDTTGLLGSSEKKIVALNSITNIIANGINNADREAQGIQDGKGSGWAVPYSESKQSSFSRRRRLTAGVDSDLDGALGDLSTVASRKKASPDSELDEALSTLSSNGVTASRRTAGVFSDVIDWLAKKGEALISGLKSTYDYFSNLISNITEAVGYAEKVDNDNEEMVSAIHEVAEWLRENVKEG